MRLGRAVAGTWVVALAACAGAWWALQGDPPPSFRTGAVEKKDVRAVVTATGLLEADVSVEVGTQVSGLLDEVLVDFNERVEAGQVVARLDDARLRADVARARAELQVAEAAVSLAASEAERVVSLGARGAASPQDVEAAQTARQVAEAQRVQARVALSRAEQELSYATIVSPVSGVVVRRDVERGQTVNAGFSAPRLFLIAGDLTALSMVAAVDEADIGRIVEGQRVEFTVPAWPDERFQGEVRQVRLASNTVENVVTYEVVVRAPNPDGKLLPGMTATADFITDEAKDALCVPNAALRFRPEPAWVIGGGDSASPPEGKARRGEAKGPRQVYLDAGGGKVSAVDVKTGLSDKGCTQVAEGVLAEGASVILGVDSGGPTSGGAGGGNPLSGGRGAGGGRHP